MFSKTISIVKFYSRKPPACIKLQRKNYNLCDLLLVFRGEALLVSLFLLTVVRGSGTGIGGCAC